MIVNIEALLEFDSNIPVAAELSEKIRRKGFKVNIVANGSYLNPRQKKEEEEGTRVAPRTLWVMRQIDRQHVEKSVHNLEVLCRVSYTNNRFDKEDRWPAITYLGPYDQNGNLLDCGGSR